jgi:hypothetical protein
LLWGHQTRLNLQEDQHNRRVATQKTVESR